MNMSETLTGMQNELNLKTKTLYVHAGTIQMTKHQRQQEDSQTSKDKY